MFAKSLSAAAMVHSKNGCIPEGPLVRGFCQGDSCLGEGLAWLDGLSGPFPFHLFFFPLLFFLLLLLESPSISDSVVQGLSPSKYSVYRTTESLVNGYTARSKG